MLASLEERNLIHSLSLYAVQGKFHEISEPTWKSLNESTKVAVLEKIPKSFDIASYAHLLPEPSLNVEWYLRYAESLLDYSPNKAIELINFATKKDTSANRHELVELGKIILAYEGFLALLLLLRNDSNIGNIQIPQNDSNDELGSVSSGTPSLFEYRKGFLFQLVQSISFKAFKKYWSSGDLGLLSIPPTETWLPLKMLGIQTLPNGIQIPAQVIAGCSEFIGHSGTETVANEFFSLPCINHRNHRLHNQLTPAFERFRLLDNQTLEQVHQYLGTQSYDQAMDIFRSAGYDVESSSDLKTILKKILAEIQDLSLASADQNLPWHWHQRFIEAENKGYQNLSVPLLFECLSTLSSI